MSGQFDQCFGTLVQCFDTPAIATTLLLSGQARSDQCFGTPASATALLLRGQTRSDRCFGTPASAMTLLLRAQTRISSVLYHTFGFLVYCVPLIHGSRSR